MIGTTKSSVAKFAGAMVLGLAILVWSGCGGGLAVEGPDSKSEGMTVTPSSITMRSGEATQFTAQLSGSTGSMSQTFTWYVNGVATGKRRSAVSTKPENTGHPPPCPRPHSVTIKAVSNSDKTRFATSSVSLQNPIPVLQNVSPTFLPVGNFTLTRGRRELCQWIQSDIWWNHAGHHVCGSHPAHGHWNDHRGPGRNGQDHSRES